ncbi:MAG: VCBS repeat-containing protein, partial [Phycisphaerales bacterium]|nr:VCBS repeat-containing protein [Phycisphaerales bacterium]
MSILRTNCAARTFSPALWTRLGLAGCLFVPMIAGCERTTPPTSQPASTTQPGAVSGVGANSAQARFDTATLRGKALYENRDANGAILAFEAARAAAPADPRGRRNLARGLLRAQRYERAEQLIADAARVEQDSAVNHYLLGLARLHRDDPARAAASFESARRLDQNNSTIQFQLALALKAGGEQPRIRELLESVLALDPLHWSAHYQLANLLRAAGDADGFQSHMREFERISESLPYTKRGADALEDCAYTQIEIGHAVLEPPAEAPLEWRVVELSAGWAELLGRIDIDGDSRYELIVQDRESVHIDKIESGNLQRVGPPLFTCAGASPVTTSRSRACDFHAAQVADFDNDGRQDVLLTSDTQGRLFRAETTEALVDVTHSSGLDLARCIQAVWADFDHDGDLDLIAVSIPQFPELMPENDAGRPTVTLYLNLGNGTFERLPNPAWMPEFDSNPVVFSVDFDNDDARDLVITSLPTQHAPIKSALWLRSIGLGEFHPCDGPLNNLDGQLLAVADLDNDLLVDAVIGVRGRIDAVYRSGRRQVITNLDGPGYLFSDARDVDADGWLDLIIRSGIAHHTGAAKWAIIRNGGRDGWRVLDDWTSPKLRDLNAGRVQVFDANLDLRPDILLSGENGMHALFAQASGPHRSITVHLTGTRSNRSGIGTRIEIRTANLQLMRDAWELPVEIGVGEAKTLDVVRTAWTNGVIRNDLNIDPSRSLSVEEPFVAVGSCPYLYAWDGREMRFVTDLLGAAPLGLSLRRGMFVPADPDEFVWIGDESRLAPRAGRYVLQITDELREVLYLDEVRLFVVDHPAGTDVYPNDRIQAPPFPPSELWLLDERIALQAARDSAGNDCTAALGAEDGERVGPSSLRETQLRGLAQPHAVELDFGALADSRDLVLALNGWILWGDASVNVAAGQNADLPFPFPGLEALAGETWRPVSTFIGAPCGKPKRYAVDLNGALPANTPRLRLTTAYEIYWDQIALYRRAPSERMHVTRLDPVIAELSYRGVAKQSRPRRSDPVTPDSSRISAAPEWRGEMSGWCTRYGDVRELLAARDDRLVILNTGDAATLEFPAELPPPQPGMRRDFYLWLVGWDKDS